MSGEGVEIKVAIVSWMYPSTLLVAAEERRAKEQFAGRGFHVFAGKSETHDEGFLAFVGPQHEIERAEEEWDARDGERVELRDDIVDALGRRHLELARGIVIREDGDYEISPDLADLYEAEGGDT